MKKDYEIHKHKKVSNNTFFFINYKSFYQIYNHLIRVKR